MSHYILLFCCLIKLYGKINRKPHVNQCTELLYVNVALTIAVSPHSLIPHSEMIWVVFDILQCKLLKDKHFYQLIGLISNAHRLLKIRVEQMQLGGWNG